jgi:transcriptional regulator with GAF, ATPase, and Fis domain
MTDTLSTCKTLDYEALWRTIRKLLERMMTALDRDTFINDCLDNVVELFGADRGLILLNDGQGGTHVVNARGHNRALNPYEREEISKTVIQQVQETGKTVVWEPNLKGTESIHALGILAAVAAPLRAFAWVNQKEGEEPAETEQVQGVLYLDLRDMNKQIGELQKEFFESAAILLSAVVEQNHRLQVTREHLRQARAESSRSAKMPGLHELLRGDSMAHIRREVESCLQGDSPILITGETGTGKTILAQAIAEASKRQPVVRAVLGSSDDLNTITSELFGHERGAFSGAIGKRVGMVEFANRGTLILDEILNLPPHAQQLLLDFTQFGSFRPLGYDKAQPKQAQVRLITATNGDLQTAIGRDRFRQDLYYRLAAVQIRIPPLRERREDIPALAEALLRRMDPVRSWRLSVPLRRMLLSDDPAWPGNIRQLESVIRRARERALTEDGHADTLRPEHLQASDLGLGVLPAPSSIPVGSGESICQDFHVDDADLSGSYARMKREREEITRIERTVLERALAKHDGVVAYAARELGVSRTGLISRLDTLGIPRRRRRSSGQG